MENFQNCHNFKKFQKRQILRFYQIFKNRQILKNRQNFKIAMFSKIAIFSKIAKIANIVKFFKKQPKNQKLPQFTVDDLGQIFYLLSAWKLKSKNAPRDLKFNHNVAI